MTNIFLMSLTRTYPETALYDVMFVTCLDRCIDVSTETLALVPKAKDMQTGQAQPPRTVLPGTYHVYIGGVKPGALGVYVDGSAAQQPQGPLELDL